MNAVGTLNVKPISGKLKRDTESVGSMDPFCLVTLGTTKQKTKVHENGGKFPSWNESLPMRRSGESMLTVEVWDKDTFSNSDLIGEVTIPLSEILEKKSVTQWYILSYKGKNAGEVLIEFKWFPDSSEDLEKAKLQANFGIPMQVNTGMLMMQGAFSGGKSSSTINPMIGTSIYSMPQQQYYMPQQQYYQPIQQQYIPTQQQYTTTQQQQFIPTQQQQQYMQQYIPQEQQYTTTQQQQFPTTQQQQYATTQQQQYTTQQQPTQQQQYQTTQQQQQYIPTQQQTTTIQQQQYPSTQQQQYTTTQQPTQQQQQPTQQQQYQSTQQQQQYAPTQQQTTTNQQQQYQTTQQQQQYAPTQQQLYPSFQQQTKPF